MSRSPLYTEVFTLKISKVQKQTLDKLKSRNIKVSSFVRKAISEKIKRDYALRMNFALFKKEIEKL